MPAGRAPPVSPVEGRGIALLWGGSGSIGTGARPSPGDPSANGPSLFVSVELGARAGDRVAVATPPARASGGRSEPDSLLGVGANHAESGLASGGDGTDVIPAVSTGDGGSDGTNLIPAVSTGDGGSDGTNLIPAVSTGDGGSDGTDMIPAVSTGDGGSDRTDMMSAVATGDTGGGGAGETAGGLAPFCVFPASGDTLEDRSRLEALGPFSPLSGTVEISPSTTADTTGSEPTWATPGKVLSPSPWGKREARPNGRFGALRCGTTAGRAIESS